MLDTKWLEIQIKQKVQSQDARSLGVESLIISKSYVESDIIWENLKKSQMVAIVKRTFLFLIMLIISFVLVTPAYVIGVLNPVKDDFKNKFVDADLSQYI